MINTHGTQETEHNLLPAADDIRQPVIRWHHTIRFRLFLGLVALLAMLLGSGLAMIWLRELPILLTQRHQLNTTIGMNLVNALRQPFSQAQTLSRSLAHLAETMPADPALARTLIPGLLDNTDLRTLIAGGGIWPEPDAFKKGIARSSFFWGRNAQGEMAFFNDYNDPAGPGYHHQEWYVPAKIQEGPQSYWSRSYTDPYSLQPMVTCTTPYFRNNRFSGVSTVDLKLDGVHTLTQQPFKQQPGYAYVVDRNNTFIAFPDMSQISTQRRDPQGKPIPDFINVTELALHQPVFAPQAEKLTALLNDDNRTTTTPLADRITAASDQIEPQEARIIANNLSSPPLTELTLLTTFQANDDLLLRTPVDVFIYQMPHTFWKVAVVFPVSETTRVARAISRNLAWTTLAGISLWSLLLTLFIWKIILEPLKRITASVEQAARENREVTLDHPLADEMGQLAHWYNQRTRQLNTALEQAKRLTHTLTHENHTHQISTAKLEKNLAQQKAIIDSANNPILFTDISGMILTSNVGTEKRLGYPAEELIGKIFPHTLIRDTDLQASGFGQFIAPSPTGDIQEREWSFTHKDGSQITLLLNVTPVKNPQGDREGWLIVGTDISHIKQTEAALKATLQKTEHTQQANNRFLASLSPNLHAPLEAILGFVHQLQKKLLNVIDHRHMDSLNAIEHNASHLMTTVKNVLDLSTIEAGQMALQQTEFDLVTLVSDIHEETRPLTEGRPIAYGCHLPASPILMQGDRARIHQIIHNLLANAFKNTEHGNIDLQLSAPHHDHSITLRVTDTGKGMSMDDSRKLRQKLTHPDINMEDRASTDLGLYLTLQLVKLLNGQLTFDSIPGKGSHFTVKLPLRADREQPAS